MKKILIALFLMTLVLIAGSFFVTNETKQEKVNPSPTGLNIADKGSDESSPSVVTENLDTPWSMVFLPSKDLLITERNGAVRLVRNGQENAVQIARVPGAYEVGEGGLLGVTLDPDFEKNSFVYFYFTYSQSNGNTLNRVIRMKYTDGSLGEEEMVLDNIPGASNHNGGRIKFGPDGLLYIATGDAQNPSSAQDTESLAGKILRVTPDGSPAPGNKFNNRIYSYGHRNVQGLTWDDEARLWATEHGRSGVLSGLDELNQIDSGKNYGWPEIQGDENLIGMETAKKNSGNTTWAPAGAVFYDGSVFFTGLRGAALYEAVLDGTSVMQIKEHFKGEFGRLRDVILGPDNMLYVATSNMDGRGSPKKGDDKIIKINPSNL